MTSEKELFEEILWMYELAAEQATRSRRLYGSATSHRCGASRVTIEGGDGGRMARLVKALPELKAGSAITWDEGKQAYTPNESKARARAKELYKKF